MKTEERTYREDDVDGANDHRLQRRTKDAGGVGSKQLLEDVHQGQLALAELTLFGDVQAIEISLRIEGKKGSIRWRCWR